MSPTLLLTLGRLPKGLDVARSFKALGWRVLVVDPMAWHLCRVSNAVARSYQAPPPAENAERYLERLAEIVRKEGVDLVVSVAEEALYVADLPRLVPGVRLYGPGSSQLTRLHDKLLFNDWARALGFDAPRSWEPADPDAIAYARQAKVVVKPRRACSGKGLQIHQAGAWSGACPQEPALVQAFVEGEVVSSFTIAHAGRSLGTVVYRGRVMSGTVAVGFERLDAPRVVDWAERFIAAVGGSGFISFDFVVEDDGRPLAIECNPRLTSGVHFVDPRDLAAAMVAPETIDRVRFRPDRRSQQFYPVLTETRAPLFWSAEFRRNAPHLFTRDVSFSWRDPAPFALLPIVSYEILARSIGRGLTFGEAATADIEWREPEAS